MGAKNGIVEHHRRHLNQNIFLTRHKHLTYFSTIAHQERSDQVTGPTHRELLIIGIFFIAKMGHNDGPFVFCNRVIVMSMIMTLLMKI